MKGVSLAIETIIFIILAVTVLSVLLLFLTGTGGPAQDRVALESNRNIICGDYVRAVPLCDNDGSGSKIKDLNKLKDICIKLGAANPQGKTPAAKDPCGQSGQVEECYAACCRLFCIRK
ncbi:MAG: hypothetical protein HY514_00420 [Candidatus Aenigmarchaeota archaeon]|nr:hypothetical protein [Candidatus Aenigmarchaeota archaeon]